MKDGRMSDDEMGRMIDRAWKEWLTSLWRTTHTHPIYPTTDIPTPGPESRLPDSECANVDALLRDMGIKVSAGEPGEKGEGA